MLAWPLLPDGQRHGPHSGPQTLAMTAGAHGAEPARCSALETEHAYLAFPNSSWFMPETSPFTSRSTEEILNLPAASSSDATASTVSWLAARTRTLYPRDSGHQQLLYSTAPDPERNTSARRVTLPFHVSTTLGLRHACSPILHDTFPFVLAKRICFAYSSNLLRTSTTSQSAKFLHFHKKRLQTAKVFSSNDR